MSKIESLCHRILLWREPKLTEMCAVIATIAALESTVNEYQKTKDGKKDMP